MATLADKKHVSDVLDRLQNSQASDLEFDAVLDAYEGVKNRAERVGLCHNFAIALLRDFGRLGLANGWRWCRALITDAASATGVDHSWVEYEGWCVDVGDDDQVRIWAASSPPGFQVVGPPGCRDLAATETWVKAVDELGEKLQADILACHGVVCAALIVSGSPIRVPVPHRTAFSVSPVAWIGVSLPEIRGVAVGFSGLSPGEMDRVETHFPDHLPSWVP